MVDSSVQKQEVVLILCHSFFHDAFRMQKEVTTAVWKTWMSSHFIANLIIERQSELPEESQFATTSQQVFDSFASKFQGDNPSARLIETLDILRNSIYIIKHPSVTRLSIDDSVFVICDTLYSRQNYSPVLISNIPSKLEKAEEFYHKKDPHAKIPFPIYTAMETEIFLRGRFPEESKIVDERIRNATP